MYVTETRPSAAGLRTPVKVSSADGAPAQWHRLLTLLADIGLFVGTRPVWAQAASHRPLVAAVISLCYASILTTGVLVLVVRRGRSLARLDLCVLVTAVTLTLCAYAMDHGGSDEALLTTQAARQLAHGLPVYGQPWPGLFGRGVALTPTVTGGYDFTYGYPPLSVLLTAPFVGVGHGAMAATLVSTGALLVGAVVMWWLLPVPWRSAATLVCLGFGLLPDYARLGYPAVVALAPLVPVVVRWPGTGAGGRLGPAGLTRAACLGAACAAQQLPWFLAPFLLAGIYAVRRGELGPREAARVLGRFVAVASTVWLLINTYFIVRQPHDWLSGIALPLTQGAVVHGQGLVGISLYLTDGSGRLVWYSYASLLLAAALLALFVLFVRRLGPAAAVLPWCAFYLATRSQDGYYLLMTPLWVAAAVTAPPAPFATAWQPRLGLGRRARAGLSALLLAPAAIGVTVAAASAPPLRMTVLDERPAGRAALADLTVRVTNLADDDLRPHFTLTTGQGMSRYWSVARGPAVLARHASATYELRPPTGKFTLPRHGVRIRLRAFTGAPMTLSSTDVRDGP